MNFLPSPAVVPVLIGPLQVLIAIAPAIGVSILGIVLALAKPATMKKLVLMVWQMKLTLTPIAFAIFAAFYWLPGVFSSTGAVTESEKSNQDWSMFRGGLERRGAASNAVGPLQGEINWAFDSDVKTFYSSPTVVGNRVYATSADKGIYADSGAIYCLDADTGGVVWKTTPSGYRATFSSPAVEGDYLVCGEGLHFTTEAKVFCLDISAEGKGKVLWSFETNSHVESSPAIYENKVYIGAGSDGYYCLALEGDGNGNAKVLWHAEGKDYPDAETCPAVVDDKVFVGLGMGGNAVVCLDANTGAEIWRVKTPFPVFSPPTISNGRVIVGMGNANFIFTAEEVIVQELKKMKDKGATVAKIAEEKERLSIAGEIWSINITNPTEKWIYEVPRSVLGAVVAVDDKLFFGSRDGNFYSITQNGKLIGKWNSHEPIMVCPAYTNGVIYFITSAGKLYGLDIETMEPVWSFTVGVEGMFLSSPAIARGHIYIGSESYGLLSIGESAKVAKKQEIWAGYLGGAGKGGVLKSASIPEKGSLLWKYPNKTEKDTIYNGALAILNDNIYVPVSSPKKGLLCLTNTKDAKEKTSEKWFFETKNEVSLSPATNDENVFCVDGIKNCTNRKLYCLSKDGKEKWSIDINDNAAGRFVLFNDCIIVANSATSLTYLDLNGKTVWTKEFGQIDFIPAKEGSILITVDNLNKELIALDKFTGMILWKSPLNNIVTAPIVVKKKIIYIGDTQGISTYDITNGSLIWHKNTGQVVNAFVTNNNYIAYVNSNSELIIMDKINGDIIKKIEGVNHNIPPLLSKNQIFFQVGDYIDLYNINDKNRVNWTKTSWMGNITTPLVMNNSRIYFGTEKYGLIRTGRR